MFFNVDVVGSGGGFCINNVRGIWFIEGRFRIVQAEEPSESDKFLHDMQW